jgi:hypothetical protein
MLDTWLRRHAIQIAAQLPEKPEDAILVLDLARQLVEDFLKPQAAPARPERPLPPAEVIRFPAASSSA